MDIHQQSITLPQNVLRPRDEVYINHNKEERRRTGRYLAGGVALAMILIVVHHAFARGASAIGGIWTPAVIMAAYIVWVLYVARKDREKDTRLESAPNLAAETDISAAETDSQHKKQCQEQLHCDYVMKNTPI